MIGVDTGVGALDAGVNNNRFNSNILSLNNKNLVVTLSDEVLN